MGIYGTACFFTVARQINNLEINIRPLDLMVARRNTCLEIRKEPDVLSNLVRWDQHIEMDNLLIKKVLA
jgi:hypothetical protein